DYAHTPDALANVLGALRPLTTRRLLCVFGCGGDRDPSKRPRMGAAVAELADLAFVTSDNPRTEDPRAIIDQILPGVPKPFVVDDTRLGIGAIAHAHRKRWTGKLVAITGSAGKTTTKELARAALSATGPTHAADGSLNNETGVPLTLLGLRPFHAYGVVEMGM